MSEVQDLIDNQKLGEYARREQLALDTWDDGERDLERIAADVKLSVVEIRRALMASGLTTWEDDDYRLRVADLGAEHHDQTFLFDTEVASAEGPMMIPVRVAATCVRCGTSQVLEVDSVEYTLATPKRRKELSTPLNIDDLSALRKQNRNLERLLEQERDLRIYAQRLLRERFLRELEGLYSFPDVREAMRHIVRLLDKLGVFR